MSLRRFRGLRQEAGLYQLDLAEESGVSIWVIRRIEADPDGHNPRLNTLRSLAKVLAEHLGREEADVVCELVT